MGSDHWEIVWIKASAMSTCTISLHISAVLHDDVIKWKHFPRYWPFVREFTGHRWIPAQRPVTRSFYAYFDLRLNKGLGKQSWGWWFETLPRPLWRHSNDCFSPYFCGMYISRVWYIQNNNIFKTVLSFIPYDQLSLFSCLSPLWFFLSATETKYVLYHWLCSQLARTLHFKIVCSEHRCRMQTFLSNTLSKVSNVDNVWCVY